MFVRINIPAWSRREIGVGLKALTCPRDLSRVHSELRDELHRCALGWSVELHASGRSALARAITNLGLAGERVAVPAYACHAVIEAVRWAGAEPVFVDCAVDSFMYDRDAFSSLQRTQPVAWAIVPTTYGQSDIDLEAVPEDVDLILDAAYLGGRPLPALADDARVQCVVWSFNFKSFASVGGGALLHRGASRTWTERRPRVRASELRRFANYAARALLRERIPRAFPGAARPGSGRTIGRTTFDVGPMSTLQASVLLEQVKRAHVLASRNRQIVAGLADLISSGPCSTTLTLLSGGPYPHLAPCIVSVQKRDLGATASQLRRALHRRGVQTEEPYELPRQQERYPNACRLHDGLVLVPCGPYLDARTSRRVMGALRDACAEVAASSVFPR